MAGELRFLACAVGLCLVHLICASIAAQPQRGLKWNVGPRDEPVVLTGMAGRLERAFANYRETFPFFAALVLVSYLGHGLSNHAYWGALIYLVARIVYLPLYAFGVTYLRTAAWAAALVGMMMIAAGIVVGNVH